MLEVILWCAGISAAGWCVGWFLFRRHSTTPVAVAEPDPELWRPPAKELRQQAKPINHWQNPQIGRKPEPGLCCDVDLDTYELEIHREARREEGGGLDDVLSVVGLGLAVSELLSDDDRPSRSSGGGGSSDSDDFAGGGGGKFGGGGASGDW